MMTLWSGYCLQPVPVKGSMREYKGNTRDVKPKYLRRRRKKAPSGKAAVMTVTPVANCDRAWRNCFVSNSEGEPLTGSADMVDLRVWVDFKPY